MSDRGMLGVGVFSLGGAFLIYVFYSILENVGKPWIDQALFLWFFIMPLGLVAFFMLGWGLLLMLKSQKGSVTS